MLKHRQLPHERVAQLLWAFEKRFWRERLPPQAVVTVRTLEEEFTKLQCSPVKPRWAFDLRFAASWFKSSGSVQGSWRRDPEDDICSIGAEPTARSPLPVDSAARLNLLEEVVEEIPWNSSGLRLKFRPFEITTIRLA